jgi:hypothetical protein
VLEMRDSSQNLKLKQQKLESLARHFLRITGQERESHSGTGIETANRAPSGTTLTM